MNAHVPPFQPWLELQSEVLRASARVFEDSQKRWSVLCSDGIREATRQWQEQERELVRRLSAEQSAWPSGAGLWGAADEGMHRLNAIADVLAADQSAVMDHCRQVLGAWQALASRSLESGEAAQTLQDFLAGLMAGMVPEVVPSQPAQEPATVRRSAPRDRAAA